MVLFLLSASISIGSEPAFAENGITPTYLRCERIVDPLGIDATSPHLSWYSVPNDLSERGENQSAYEILVATSLKKLDNNTGNLWDSGKVESNQSINVVYKGRKLTSGTRCYWKVRIWDNCGNRSRWSKTAVWSTGLLHKQDWMGCWIGLDSVVSRERLDPQYTRVNARMKSIFYTHFNWRQVKADTDITVLPARMLRKEFNVRESVKRAIMYICGLGLFRLFIDGKEIGDQVLSPALSWYHTRAYYMTFNVTKYLKRGVNALGIILGNGRFYAMRTRHTAMFGYPKMICQLNIDYSDGTQKSIVSDTTWKITSKGPIRSNNEYDGEVYDARLEMPGWDQPGFNDSRWMKARKVQDPTRMLCAEMQYPERIMQSVKPVSEKEVQPGVFVYDMGQNIVGWVSLHVRVPRGTAITMRFGESLRGGGMVDFRSLGSAMQTDVYIARGGGWENWQPNFTYQGFRYVQITGYPGKPPLNMIEGKVVYDDVPTIGRFETSNEMVNRIYDAAFWTIRGNYRSIPTDCPQRNERQGWLGDHAVNSYGESFVFDNDRLYQQWMIDIRDGQKSDGALPNIAPPYWHSYNNSVTWPSALILASDNMYRQFGNIEIIKDNYVTMKKWISYIAHTYMRSYLVPGDKYGDWSQPSRDQSQGKEVDPARRPDTNFISSAYFYHCLRLMKRNADLLGKRRDAEYYSALAAKVRDAINATFLSPDSSHYAKNLLTTNILATAFGITPAVIRRRVFADMVNRFEHADDFHTSCGLIGQNWIMRTLTDNGRPDLAYRLATDTTYPSFGYMLDHHGTTIWELWDGNTITGRESFNHVMLLGDFVIWLYQDLAGIETDPSAPAFKRVIMEPTPVGDLKFVNARYRSIYGAIESDWSLEGDDFRWKVVIPPNVSAAVFVPAEEAADVTEGGVLASIAPGVKFEGIKDGRVEYEVGSGVYRFHSKSCHPRFLIDQPKEEWMSGY